MRAIFLITRADTFGGAQIYVRDVAARMQEDGHGVLVVTGRRGTFSDVLKHLGIPTEKCDTLGNAPHPFRDRRARRDLERLCDEYQPDILSAHSTKAGIIGRHAAQMRGIPCVFTTHGWAFNDATPEPLRSIYRLMERRMEPLAGRIICVSDSARRMGLDVGMSARRLVTVHNGTPDRCDRAARVGDKTGPVRIASVARLEKPKNPKALLRAVARVSDAELDMIGDGPMQPGCEGFAASLGLARRVTFHGRVPDVAGMLARSHIFALITNSEGFPLSTIEAMRAGLPVVVSDVGGAGEAIEDGVSGFLVPRGDVETLRDRLQRLVDDPALRARMGAAARRRYEEHFTFERMYEKTMAVYEEVIAEHKGRAAAREAVGGRA